jgi:hypothetical protein
MTREQPTRPQGDRIANAAQAREAIRRLDQTVDGLEQILVQEGLLVRAGRLVEAAKLAAKKEELARAYICDAQRLKDSLPRLRGELGDALGAVKARHADFRTRLEVNLTVLATAHAVSEGIIRGLSEQITRNAAPQVYGASGRAAKTNTGHAAPLAVYRVL